MTYANRASDGEILRDVCLMSKEMWQARQQLDDTLIDWDQLNDLVHQTFAVSAAKSVGGPREGVARSAPPVSRPRSDDDAAVQPSPIGC